MPFSDRLAEIGHYPNHGTGVGIIPPIIRLTTHLTHILDDLLNEREWTLTDQDAEMVQLRAHADGLYRNSPTVSDATNGQLRVLHDLIYDYSVEFPRWREGTQEPREALTNTQEALNRLSAIGTQLDRELAAIFQSDPGRDV